MIYTYDIYIYIYIAMRSILSNDDINSFSH